MPKISSLSSLTDPVEGDLLAVVDSSASTTKKITVGVLLATLHTLTSLADPATDDTIAIVDTSANETKKATVNDLLNTVSTAASLSSPDSSDTLQIVDTSEGVTKRITLSTIRTMFLQTTYPVGSLYFNATNGTNPGTLLGFGTWVAFGAGRVPVGYNSGEAEFNAAEKTGGGKTHTLTQGEMPWHNHTVSDPGHQHGHVVGGSGGTTYLIGTGGDPYLNATNTGVSYTGVSVGYSGSGWAHNNLQPYITVFIWKRTA